MSTSSKSFYIYIHYFYSRTRKIFIYEDISITYDKIYTNIIISIINIIFQPNISLINLNCLFQIICYFITQKLTHFWKIIIFVFLHSTVMQIRMKKLIFLRFMSNKRSWRTPKQLFDRGIERKITYTRKLQTLVMISERILIFSLGII